MTIEKEQILNDIIWNLRALHKHYSPIGWGGLDPADFQDRFIRLKVPFIKPGVLQYMLDGAIGVNLTGSRLLKFLLNIKPHSESKATALAIRSYCRLSNEPVFDDTSTYVNKLCDYLWRLQTGRTKNASWGASYAWMTGANKVFVANGEALLNTAISGIAFLKAYQLTDNDLYLRYAQSAGRYITEENGYAEHDGGDICFFYTPLVKMQITNANAIGAQFLYQLSTYGTGHDYITYAERAFGFIASSQQSDGSWFYYPLRKPCNNVIDNYHTGFILEALIDAYSRGNSKLKPVIKRGLEFYRKLFAENGKPAFKVGQEYPIDIHDIAQGILVFSLASSISSEYQRAATAIWNYARQRMRKDDGRYIARIYRHTRSTKKSFWKI